MVQRGGLLFWHNTLSISNIDQIEYFQEFRIFTGTSSCKSQNRGLKTWKKVDIDHAKYAYFRNIDKEIVLRPHLKY